MDIVADRFWHNSPSTARLALRGKLVDGLLLLAGSHTRAGVGKRCAAAPGKAKQGGMQLLSKKGERRWTGRILRKCGIGKMWLG